MPSILYMNAFRQKQINEILRILTSLSRSERTEFFFEKIDDVNVFELFSECAKFHDFETLLELFSSSRDEKLKLINGELEHTSSLVVYSAKIGNTELIKYLKNNYQINLDARNQNSNTILTLAINSKNYDLLKFLINECNLVPTINDPEITNLLMEQDIFMIEYILFESKEKVKNSCDFIYNSFLKICSEGWIETLRYFIEEFHPQYGIFMKLDAIISAVKNGHYGIVKFLIEIYPEILDPAEKFKNIILFAAIENEHDDIIKLIYEKTKNDNINISIIEASKEKNFLAVKYLREKLLVDINIEDIFGINPLVAAIDTNDINLVKYIILQGADTEKPDLSGYTPIMIAILEGNIDIIKYLIEEVGVSLNVINEIGYSPLILAISTNNLEIVKYLVETVKVPLLENITHNNPFDYARRIGNEQICQYLCNYSKETNQITIDGPDDIHMIFELDDFNPLMVQVVQDLHSSLSSLGSFVDPDNNLT